MHERAGCPPKRAGLDVFMLRRLPCRNPGDLQAKKSPPKRAKALLMVQIWKVAPPPSICGLVPNLRS